MAARCGRSLLPSLWLQKDYAVNGMAGARYASIQPVWKSTNIDIGPIISRGLTLCKW